MGNHVVRRVVVTGIGMVTPLGVGKDRFREALWRGETGIREIAAFPTDGFGSHLGAEIRAFQPRDFISLKNLRKMDRLSAMTTASVRMALDDAGIAVTEANRDRIGIVMGTAFGNTELKVQSARILFTEGPGMVNPIHVPNTVMNAPAGHASIELGFRGVNTTVNHQAVSAEMAIAYAAMEIRRGTADVILAGGVDILSPFFYETLDRFRALSPADGGAEGARPFDLARNGPVMGEGCGIVCLEAGELARERGAAPYCEMTGWGLASPRRRRRVGPPIPAGFSSPWSAPSGWRARRRRRSIASRRRETAAASPTPWRRRRMNGSSAGRRRTAHHIAQGGDGGDLRLRRDPRRRPGPVDPGRGLFRRWSGLTTPMCSPPLRDRGRPAAGP